MDGITAAVTNITEPQALAYTLAALWVVFFLVVLGIAAWVSSVLRQGIQDARINRREIRQQRRAVEKMLDRSVRELEAQQKTLDTYEKLWRDALLDRPRD